VNAQNPEQCPVRINHPCNVRFPPEPAAPVGPLRTKSFAAIVPSIGNGLANLDRPTEVSRFEVLAGMAIVFSLLSSLTGPKGVSVWAFAFAGIQIGIVYWVSRYQSRAGRIVWSGLLLLGTFFVVVGLWMVIHRSLNMPTMSGVDIFLSVAILSCNIAAALFVWSGPASKWLAARPA
jgi:hypothetical protein